MFDTKKKRIQNVRLTYISVMYDVTHAGTEGALGTIKRLCTFSYRQASEATGTLNSGIRKNKKYAKIGNEWDNEL